MKPSFCVHCHFFAHSRSVKSPTIIFKSIYSFIETKMYSRIKFFEVPTSLYEIPSFGSPQSMG